MTPWGASGRWPEKSRLARRGILLSKSFFRDTPQ